MKKTLLIAGTLLFFSLAPHVLAEGFVPLAPIPGLTEGVTANTAGLASFFNNLYKFLIGIAATLAVIMIIWGGLEISTQDSVSKQSAGRERITQAILGLILVLSPVLVFSIINPSILNLSLNIDKLNVMEGVPVGMGGVSAQPAPTTIASGPGQGCVVSGTYLKKATCPSEQLAQDWASSACSTGNATVECTLVDPSGGCTGAEATCESVSKIFMFLDVSNKLNPIIIFSNYQPLVSTPDNPNNGGEAVQFIGGCTAEGGLSCLTDKNFFSSDCSTYYTKSQPASQSNKCYKAKLTCIPNKILNKSTECSSNPSYTPIP
jgi:type IV secretory pathway VirB2 component (pilin)